MLDTLENFGLVEKSIDLLHAYMLTCFCTFHFYLVKQTIHLHIHMYYIG